ncbi:unnamed protein product [Menidia menidia]|uniref:(Atlantic silverside) hypothetical protein n=1 Tax=Menidia menidia TaxID=238744 RepID=A0A8S4AWZ3_9TELE|nr:unnamed protein product [Menidia menidia]
MGNLLKVLTCTDLEQEPNFFLDFENAQPTEAEREVWEQVDVVLKDAKGILDELQAYKGAGQEIREAIQNPNDEALQEQAWAAVVPLVGKLKKFYEFSQRLAGRATDASTDSCDAAQRAPGFSLPETVGVGRKAYRSLIFL